MIYKFLLLLLIPLFIRAQSAEKIVARNLEKTGGYEAWTQLHSVQIKGEITLGINEIYPIEIYQKRPDWTLSVIQLKGKNFILEGYNGTKAIQNDFSNGKIINIANYQPEKFDSDLLNYKSKGFTLSYEGETTINHKRCDKIALHKHTNVTYYYFDTTTAYLIREEKKGEILEFSNFKQVNELIFPYTIESINSQGESTFLLRVQSLVTNKQIPKELFNF